MGWMISPLSSSENTKICIFNKNPPYSLMMVVDESLKRKKTKINLEVAIRFLIPSLWFHHPAFMQCCCLKVQQNMLKRSPPLDFSQHSTHPHPIFLLRKYPKETGTISSRVSSCLPLNSPSMFSLCGFKAEYRLMLESYLRVGKHFPPTSITDRFTLRLETPLSLRLRVSRETHQHLLSLWMRS